MARPIRIEQAGGWYHVTARAMNAGRFSATTIGLNEYAALGMTVTHYRSISTAPSVKVVFIPAGKV